MLIKEVWKSINESYQVSNMGRVRSVDRLNRAGRRIKGQIIKPKITTRGYHSLQIDGKDSLVHRLVAQAFIPNPESKPQVNHKDAIKTNNLVENLEWATSSENNYHRYAMGLHNQDGVRNPAAKFTEEDVREIRRMLTTAAVKEISAMYGVSDGAIYALKNGKTYKDVR